MAMQAKWKPADLIIAIKTAAKKAREKCEGLKSKDVVCLIGSTGSGKTTLVNYALDNPISVNGRTLQPSKVLPGFEMGSQFASLTRGMEAADLDNSLCIVDLAGTGDTEGEIREVEGAIFRSSVLQTARTVRIVLVFHLSRLKVDRGKHLVQDLEHIAQMLTDVPHTPVGMVLTADPELLRESEAQQEMLETMHEALPQLVDKVEEGTMEIKVPGVKLLLHYFTEHFEAATDQEAQLLGPLEGGYRAVYPANVTKPKQRPHFLKFLACLPPIGDPSHSLACPLPQACQSELGATLGKMFMDSSTLCRERGPAWASESQIVVERVVDLLHLAGILRELKLLPMVANLQEDLEEAVLSQNKKAVDNLLTGVALGTPAPVEPALRALSTMERLSVRLKEQGVQASLEEWVCRQDAVNGGCLEAQKAMAKLVPEGIAGDVKWDVGLVNQVCGVLESVDRLGHSGAKLLEQWAHDLIEQCERLVSQVTDSTEATGTLYALARLKEQQGHLPLMLEVLGKHCEKLTGVSSSFERAKEALLAQLKELSQKMEEEGSPSHRLEELCKSTELNAELGEDLFDRFITKPLAITLAVKQDDVDCVCQLLRDPAVDYDVWSFHLHNLAIKVASVAQLGAEVLKTCGTSYADLLDAVRKKTGEAKKVVTGVFSRFRTIAEGFDTPSSASTCDDDEHASRSQVYDALHTLAALLPADPLLRHFSCSMHDMAGVALQLVFGLMHSRLKDCLRRAREVKHNKCYAGASLDGDVIDVMSNLKLCTSLATVFLGEAPDSCPLDALDGIRQCHHSSEKLIESVLEKELEEWNKAEAGARNWTQVFTQYLNTARRLKSLSPQQIGPHIQRLHLEVTNWQSMCLQKADEALAAGNWRDFIEHAIRRGMDFEFSELFSLMRNHQQFQLQFQPLVEQQASAWKQMAEASQYSGSKRQHWEKLNAMCTALSSLRGFRKETETRELHEIKELHAGLKEALRPLETTLLGNNERLLQTCDAKNFAEAVTLLRSVSDPAMHREVVMEHLKHHTEALCDELDAECEEDAVQAIKKANKVIREIETFNDDEAKKEAFAHKERLKRALDGKREEIHKQLQKALHSYGSLSRPLAMGAALGQTSKEHVAEEVLAMFKDSETKAFQGLSLPELSQWAVRHAGVRKSMPTEFRACKEALEALTASFVKEFKRASFKERDELTDCIKKKMWGEAKLKREMIQDALSDVEGLEMLESKAKEFKPVKRSVGLVAGDDKPMYEDLGEGDFRRAVQALVVSGTGDRADTICSAIQATLDAHMNVKTVDGTVNTSHLQVLESFLQEVGDNPPDELRELYTRAQLSCSEVSAQVGKEVDQTIRSMVEAAKSHQLSRMAKALSSVEQFKFRITEQQRSLLEPAKHDFWDGITKAVKKVGKDVETLDPTSLTLSTRPLGEWLQAFAVLRKEEQEALMASLRSDYAATDLSAWMRHTLAKLLQDLVDGTAVMKQAREQNFESISVRCRVAERLHKTIQSEPLDLEPVKVHLLSQKEEAAEAVHHKDLRAFNKGLKLLKTAHQELPEAALGDDLAELEQGFHAKVLQPMDAKLRGVKDIPCAINELIALRSVADEVPEVYSTVVATMTQSVKALRSNPAFNAKSINALGIQLSATPVGQQIITEQEDTFSRVKDMNLTSLFRRAGQTEAGEVVGRLTRESGLGHEEYHQLKQTLQEHESDLLNLQCKYLAQGKPIEQVLKEVKEDTGHKVTSATNPRTGRELLTQLVATYMVVRCGKEYLEAPAAEQEDLLIVPHRCQLLVLFRLLHLHKPEQSSWLGWLPFHKQRSEPTENHLAQVLTGEGKCLTLGLLAGFLALKGTGSDIVCYRKFLSEQDRLAMRPFLSFIGVEDQVRYATFDELCSERLRVIADASKELLEFGQVPNKSNVMDKSQRALLIDEVDVLFGRSFYGKTWDGGFKLRCPEAQALVRYVFNEAQAGRDADSSVLQSSELQALKDRFPPVMHATFAAAASALARNIKDWASPKPELSKDGKRIGYKERDEISYDLAYGNKTVFAYLTFEMEGRITAQVADENNGIDLVCGRFSFAELPKSYRFILGVTGTLQELLDVDGIRNVVQNDYKIEHLTYAPSVFGERRLNFKEGEHVDVQETEHDWISRIEGLVRDEKKAKNAVLVFFKNSEMLKKYPQWEDLNCLEERMDPDRRNAYVRTATGPGQVTLLTRSFGRGIDFMMPTGYQVVVVQTFLSSLVSEQTQIKGRTARQGQPGQYRLVLCKDHLEGKMSFSADEVQQMRSGSGEDIKRLLAAKQSQKTRAKAASMSTRKDKAAELERETKAWEELLFRPEEPVENKLLRLAEWNSKGAQAHYTLLLDNSYSMTPCWGQLVGAFACFCQALQKDAVTKACTTVSVVLFNSRASVLTPHHARVSEVQSIGHHFCGGGTHFGSAFAACHTLLNQPQSPAKELVLFMTDGGALFPEKQLDALLSDHSARLKRVTCVAFGGGADISCLEKISARFKKDGVPSEVKSSADAASLVEVFTEAADSLAIHGV